MADGKMARERKKLTTKELYLLNVCHYEKLVRDESSSYRDGDLKSIQAPWNDVITPDIMLEKANIARFRKRYPICPICPVHISFEINEPKLTTKELYLLNVCHYEKLVRDVSSSYRDGCTTMISRQHYQSVHISFEINEPKLKFKSFVGSNYAFFVSQPDSSASLDIAHPIKNLIRVTEG